MRRAESWLLAVTVVTGIAAGATSSSAQPSPRDHRGPPPPVDRDHRRDSPPPADRDHRRESPPADVPREAPPPPHEEKVEARAGFVWAAGRWDWRGGKWEWLPGRLERERPGQRWNPGHWDHQSDHWVLVEGSWVDGAAPPPAPPGPPADDRGDREPHREWKLDRPVVSSYWPVKGKIGSRIVIRGRNFPGDASVMWNGTQVAGAKVEPERIAVVVPPGATSGMLSLHTGQHRDLTVGNFEVADFDAEAEARRRADEEHRQAEQAWAERQKQLAKDHAARQAAVEQHHRELDESREQRRAEREKEIRAKWEAAFLADPDTQAELTLHAQRTAELARMREVAELAGNGKLVVRIGVAQSREDDRHQGRMTALHDSFGRKP